MDTAGNDDWTAQLAAAQAWWREAGVDHTYVDEPTGWLAAPAEAGPTAPSAPPPAVSVAPPPAATRIGGDRARRPATLADFGEWWLTEPTLDPAPAERRMLPRGAAGAALMVLVPMPEAEDRGELLSGAQGRLLTAILAAFGFARDDAYLASVVPSPAPAVDWAALAAAGLGEVLAHHVALAAPRRLIVFGRDVSPLLGHDPTQAAPNLTHFELESGSVPMLVAPSLAALIGKPALKRALWRRWLDWTEV